MGNSITFVYKATTINRKIVKMTQYHIFRECRKLMNILNTWGNVLVPSIPGQEETSAKERLVYIVNLAKDEHGLTLDDLDKGIKAL